MSGLPAFSVMASDGQSWSDQDLRGRRTLLVFVPNISSAQAQRQLEQLQQSIQRLASVGVEVVAVGTEAPEKLREHANAAGLSFPILSDGDRNLSRAFGVDQPLGLRGLGRRRRPAWFLLWESGEVVFSHIARDPGEMLDIGELYERLINLLASRARR